MNSELPSTVQVFGKIARKPSNALTMTFEDGPGEPLGLAEQSGGDGVGAKLGVLFGFKNGGRGTHTMKTRSGATVAVASGSGGETVITRDGRVAARVERGDVSTVRDASGNTLYVIVGDPVEVRTADAYRLRLHDAAGAEVGRLDVILRDGGWRLTFNGVLEASLFIEDAAWWLARPLMSLRLPVLGTRLLMFEPPTDEQTDVLLGVCVDLAIGLRPYVAEMRMGAASTTASS